MHFYNILTFVQCVFFIVETYESVLVLKLCNNGLCSNVAPLFHQNHHSIVLCICGQLFFSAPKTIKSCRFFWCLFILRKRA
eukprot:UN22191